MLDNKSFYKQVESQSIKGTMKKVKKVISFAKEITRHEINYLLDFEYKQNMFYGLPKINQSLMIRNEWNKINSEYLEPLDPEDLKFCPIVAVPACETHCLSNLVDIFLKPFIEKVKSCVRDDIDFPNYIPKTVTSNTLLVSVDVVNLYTNITQELGIEAINSWLSKYPDLIHKDSRKNSY